MPLEHAAYHRAKLGLLCFDSQTACVMFRLLNAGLGCHGKWWHMSSGVEECGLWLHRRLMVAWNGLQTGSSAMQMTSTLQWRL